MASADIAEVERVVNAFAEAWNHHDMERFAALFAPDAQFVNVVGMWWKGAKEIKEAHQFIHATIFRNSRLTLDEISVRFPVQELAIARCRWTLEGHTDSAGTALPVRTGILVNLLTRNDARWSIVDSQNTDIVEGVVSRPQ